MLATWATDAGEGTQSIRRPDAGFTRRSRMTSIDPPSRILRDG